MAPHDKAPGKSASPSRASKRHEDEASTFARLTEDVARALAAERQAEHLEDDEGEAHEVQRAPEPAREHAEDRAGRKARPGDQAAASPRTKRARR